MLWLTVLEYLVPSTGKLYHHKMKMRRLTGNSTVKEALTYLHKRHPLYFVTNKINEEQVVDLIKRLIYRLKMKDEMANSTKEEEKKPVAKQEPPKQQPAPPVFKSGSSLPAVTDTAAAKKKAEQMFNDLDEYDEDFDESSKHDNDFNANELLNFKDYQERRQQKENSTT